MARKSKSGSKAPTSGFRVGAKVLIPWGGGPVEGVIVEDRGFIGYKGRRLWRVRFFDDLPEPFNGEVGEEDVTLVDESKATKDVG